MSDIFKKVLEETKTLEELDRFPYLRGEEQRMLYLCKVAGKSYCPICRNYVWMLFHEGVNTPYFYICFRCEWVGQAGVGIVRSGKE